MKNEQLLETMSSLALFVATGIRGRVWSPGGIPYEDVGDASGGIL